jgi:hypothetical protein
VTGLSGGSLVFHCLLLRIIFVSIAKNSSRVQAAVFQTKYMLAYANASRYYRSCVLLTLPQTDSARAFHHRVIGLKTLRS